MFVCVLWGTGTSGDKLGIVLLLFPLNSSGQGSRNGIFHLILQYHAKFRPFDVSVATKMTAACVKLIHQVVRESAHGYAVTVPLF